MKNHCGCKTFGQPFEIQKVKIDKSILSILKEL